MIVVVPEPDTNAPDALIVSTVELSDDFLSTTLPVPPWTASSNVITRLAVIETSVALSVGESVETDGAVKSPIVKFQYVVDVCAATWLPDASLNAFAPHTT